MSATDIDWRDVLTMARDNTHGIVGCGDLAERLVRKQALGLPVEPYEIAGAIREITYVEDLHEECADRFEHEELETAHDSLKDFCRDLKGQILRLAERLLEADPETPPVGEGLISIAEAADELTDMATDIQRQL